MIVISDTTPLRYLMLLGRIDLLRRLFGMIHCPDLVLGECLIHTRLPNCGPGPEICRNGS